MFKYLTTASLALALAGTVHAEGVKGNPDAIGIAADGTWDCNDASGTYLGAIVVAELSYAFISPDGAVGSYGKLNKDEDWADLPAFVVIGGELKNRFGVVGIVMNGPVDNPMDYSDPDKLVLKAVITDKNLFFCDRRKGPAA